MRKKIKEKFEYKGQKDLIISVFSYTFYLLKWKNRERTQLEAKQSQVLTLTSGSSVEKSGLFAKSPDLLAECAKMLSFAETKVKSSYVRIKLMSTLRYAVIGMGAIGGFYGAKLARAGREVHFLLHSDYEYVLAHGLRVTSCDGDFSLPHINAYGSPNCSPNCFLQSSTCSIASPQ